MHLATSVDLDISEEWKVSGEHRSEVVNHGIDVNLNVRS